MRKPYRITQYVNDLLEASVDSTAIEFIDESDKNALRVVLGASNGGKGIYFKHVSNEYWAYSTIPITAKALSAAWKAFAGGR